MKVNFMVMCEYATQQANGAPILVGIFRGITAPELPAKLAPFWLALEIEADPAESGDHHFELTLVDEDGHWVYKDHLLGHFNRRPDLQPSYRYMAEIIQVDQPILRKGTYRFDLTKGQEMLHQLRLEIS